MSEKTRKISLSTIMGTAWCFIAFLMDIVAQFRYNSILLDDDMAAEMVLADFLNKEHSVISKNYFYSTELRVFHIQWLYRPWLLLFPNNWSMARGMSIVTALVIWIVLLIFIGKVFNLKENIIWIIAFILTPGGYWYYWQTIFYGVYIPYITFSFAEILCLGLYLRSRKNKWIPAVTGSILAVMSGLNGIKQTMVFFVPLFISSLIMLLTEEKTVTDGRLKDVIKAHSRVFMCLMFSCIVVVSNIIGYAVNAFVLAKFYNFKSYNDRSLSAGNIWEVLRDFIHSYGYRDEDSLFSFNGITSLCGLLIGILIVISMIRLFVRIRQLEFWDKLLVVISSASILVCVLEFTFLEGEIQYFQPVIPFGAFIIGIEIKTEKFEWKSFKIALWNFIMIIYFLAALGTIRDQLYNAKRAPYKITEATDWLEKQGYEQGASLFWLSEVIEEHTNGKIEMWTYCNYDCGVEVYEWLQKSSHISTEPSGKCFVLLPLNNELETRDDGIYALVKDNNGYEVWNDGFYVVYDISH